MPHQIALGQKAPPVFVHAPGRDWGKISLAEDLAVERSEPSLIIRGKLY
jgi:hypothetical protein